MPYHLYDFSVFSGRIRRTARAYWTCVRACVCALRPVYRHDLPHGDQTPLSKLPGVIWEKRRDREEQKNPHARRDAAKYSTNLAIARAQREGTGRGLKVKERTTIIPTLRTCSLLATAPPGRVIQEARAGGRRISEDLAGKRQSGENKQGEEDPGKRRRSPWRWHLQQFKSEVWWRGEPGIGEKYLYLPEEIT